MMIDAGSGGSRLHFYRFPTRVADPMQPRYGATSVPQQIFSVQTRPGISEFVHNISGIRAYLDVLLDAAKAKLEHLREEWYLIPLYLFATAGARDLFQDERDAIFAEVRAVLFQSPFRFDDNYWARTISGEEEGVHAWLTLNAIQGTYKTHDTWGALDMGGASTQIAFAPKDVSIIQNYYPLHISYRLVHLYAHSYLEFGARDANQRLVRKLHRSTSLASGDGTMADPINHPCFSKGTRFKQPLITPFAVPTEELWIQGTGNFQECIELATDLLEMSRGCTVPSWSREFAEDPTKGACGMNSVYQPTVAERNFLAIGQYTTMAIRMGLPMERLVSLSQIWPRVAEVCADATDLPNLTAGTNPFNTHVFDCWKSVWIWVVLRHGLRFPMETKQIMFAKTLHGQSTSWALGAMMNEVNYYPWKSGASGGGLFGGLGLSEPAPTLRGGEGGAAPGDRKAVSMGWVYLAAALGLCVGIGVGVVGAVHMLATSSRKACSVRNGDATDYLVIS